MLSKAKLIALAKKKAEDNFDNQMLEHLSVIKALTCFHAQHKFMLLEYVNEKEESTKAVTQKT